MYLSIIGRYEMEKDEIVEYCMKKICDYYKKDYKYINRYLYTDYFLTTSKIEIIEIID